MHAFPKISFALLVVAILLGACAPAQATLSPEQVQAQVSTSVAMTVAAQETQTAAAQPTATLTVTPTTVSLPTLAIPTAVLPTVATVVISGGGGGGGGGGGSDLSGYPYYCRDPQRCCFVISNKPKDWPDDPTTFLEPGQKMDIKWLIQNVGSKAWDKTWAWAYLSTEVNSSNAADWGLTMSSISSIATLGDVTGGTNVAKKATITLSIEVLAPNFNGNHQPINILTKWAIIGDGAKFCTPYINIQIKKPGM